MRVSKLVLIGLLAGLVWLGLNGCFDGDSPTQPKLEAPKDYPVYFTNYLNGTIFTYHPTMRLVDSALTPYDHRRLTVSADGALLYLAGDDNIVVLDTDSLGFVTELPYGSTQPVVVSPDNRLVAIASDSLVILHTSDYSIYFSDAVRLYGKHAFSWDSRIFYGVGKQYPTERTFLYEAVFQPDGAAIVSHDSAREAVWCIRPVPDGSELILANGSHLAIYDLSGDSLLSLNNPPFCGDEVAITSDGRYAFPNYPYVSLGPQRTLVDVFDIPSRRWVDSIDVRAFLDSVGEVNHYGFGGMAVTPDSRWLVVTGHPSAGRIHLFDLHRREIVDFRAFGWNQEFLSIGTQVWK